MTPARLGGQRITARGPAAWLPWFLLAHVPALAIIGLGEGRTFGHVMVDVSAVAIFAGLSFWPGFNDG